MGIDDSKDPLLGTVLQDRYRVLSHLADGAMGAVYVGERIGLGRRVAIKFLRESFAGDPQFMKRFEREARAASKLSHPHCVPVFDFGTADTPYIVMEYVSGKTLRDLLDAQSVAPARALQIAVQVLAGLAHAHGRGIVHRDIKPANVVLSEVTGTGDFVRVLDFGLAKLHVSGTEASATQFVVGTPNYMSPEQSMMEVADQRSDIYSTGILLFELLTRDKPFLSDDPFEVIRMHRSEPLPRLADRLPERNFSEQLQQVLERATAKEPDNRYGSAIEFQRAIEDVPEMPRAGAKLGARGPDPALADTMSLAAVTPTPARPGRWLRVALAVALLLVAGTVVAGLWSVTRSTRSLPVEAQREPVVSVSDGGRGPAVVDAAWESSPASSVQRLDGGLAEAAPDAGFADASAVGWDAGILDGGVPELVLLFPPDELDEPVAAVAAGKEDSDIDEPSPEEQSAELAEPVEVRTVDDAKALIAAGNNEAAIRGLRALAVTHPKSAYIPYLLGNLYFEKMWWSVGMEQYRLAIANNRTYRKRATLNRNLIRALGSDKTRRRAARMLRSPVGRAALPYLRTAARSDRNPKVRKRAASLVKSLAGKSRRR